MSAPKSNGTDNCDGDGGSKEAGVAKTAGIFVLSGIAMSIFKALTPNNKEHQPPPPPPPPKTAHEPLFQESKKPMSHKREGSPSPLTVEIVKGDTLWGFSRKYGVSIDAIKEANGLTGDTIYAGKKLVIP